MRIIAGEARGRRLFAPSGGDTRPTADRIRESLFNILGSRVPGARVLDLFGGTGALALEALSRGAESAVIVDADFRAADCIRRNAEAVLGKDWRGRAAVVRADYRSAIDRLSGGFDLIFLDPPYRMGSACADALERLRLHCALLPGFVAVAERARDRALDIPDGFSALDVRTYGDTAVEFICEGERA